MMMNKKDGALIAVALILALLIGFAAGFFSHSASSAANLVVSPKEGWELINFVKGAQKSLDVEVYLISSSELTDAIIDAKNRGVAVRVIVDKQVYDTTSSSQLKKLEQNGITVKYGVGYERYHSKFVIRDGKDILVGSHNFSYSALHQNREVSIISLNAQSLADELQKAFDEDWAAGIYADVFGSSAATT